MLNISLEPLDKWLILLTLGNTGTAQGLHPKKGSGNTLPMTGERLQ